jgi:hypothetical protein
LQTRLLPAFAVDAAFHRYKEECVTKNGTLENVKLSGCCWALGFSDGRLSVQIVVDRREGKIPLCTDGDWESFMP